MFTMRVSALVRAASKGICISFAYQWQRVLTKRNCYQITQLADATLERVQDMPLQGLWGSCAPATAGGENINANTH